MPSASLNRPPISNAPGNESRLLIITDQKGSSSFTKLKAAKAAKRHFESFIARLSGATIIKNIGDSLMIDVRLKSTNVPLFLQSLLDARSEVESEEIEGEHVKIRAIVMLLDDKDFFDGKDIAYDHPTGTPASIRGNVPKKWLNGDLFGPLIALSFRASGVPSDAIVVVDDALARLLGANDRKQGHQTVVNGATLHFGPALAFSPFKGLDLLYPFAQKQTAGNRAPWDGHLFLRTLSKDPNEVELATTNPLLRDQQKTRVFTELIWLHGAEASHYASWKKSLISKEGDAGYIRAIRVVRKEESFDFSAEDTFMPPKTDGLLMVGAYPSHDAYEKIREAVEGIKRSKDTGFAYPVTTEVHIPSRSFESDHAFWTTENSPTGSFVLAFARWIESARLNSAETASLAFSDAIMKAAAPLVRKRCGLVKGGLWDIYCIMDLNTNFPPEQGARREVFKSMWLTLQAQCIQGVVFKLCTEVPDHG